MNALFVLMMISSLSAFGQNMEDEKKYESMLLYDLKKAARKKASTGIYEQSVTQYKNLAKFVHSNEKDMAFIAVHEHGEFQSILSFWIERQAKDRLCGSGFNALKTPSSKDWISMFSKDIKEAERFNKRLKKILDILENLKLQTPSSEAYVRPYKEIHITVGIGKTIKTGCFLFSSDEKNSLNKKIEKEIDEIFKLFKSEEKVKNRE